MLKFSARIVRQLRQDRGWTLQDVAKRARIRPRTVLYVEKGHAEPKAKTLAGLAQAFEVPIDRFFVDPAKRDTETAA